MENSNGRKRLFSDWFPMQTAPHTKAKKRIPLPNVDCKFNAEIIQTIPNGCHWLNMRWFLTFLMHCEDQHCRESPRQIRNINLSLNFPPTSCKDCTHFIETSLSKRFVCLRSSAPNWRMISPRLGLWAIYAIVQRLFSKVVGFFSKSILVLFAHGRIVFVHRQVIWRIKKSFLMAWDIGNLYEIRS